MHAPDVMVLGVMSEVTSALVIPIFPVDCWWRRPIHRILKIMIASAFVLAGERAPGLRDLKRALVAYDHVKMPSPDDREVIPRHAAQSVLTGAPVGFDIGPARPLGKVREYDRDFDSTMQQCSAAVKQGLITILPPPTKVTGMVLGFPPLEPGTPPPSVVFHIFRAMASDQEFAAAASIGIDALLEEYGEGVDILAPADDVDDSVVNGRRPIVIQYQGATPSDGARAAATRLIRARIGAIVKGVAWCNENRLQPYATEPSMAAILRRLTNNARIVVDNMSSDDETVLFQRRLSIVHELVMAEYVDPSVLDSLSVEDILRLRTKAWGSALEARSALARALYEIAEAERSADAFGRRSRAAIEQYMKASSDYLHDTKKMRTTILCDLGAKIAQGTIAGEGLAHRLLALPTWASVLTVGGFLFTTAKEAIPRILDNLKERRDMEITPGYAIVRAYGALLT